MLTSMSFVVVYDACVLYPAPLRDLLVRLARTRLFHARWTEQILDECFRNIREDRPDLKPEQLARSRGLLDRAVEDCKVTRYEHLIDSIQGLPDPDDRHVVAAAVRCGAQVIVTFNLKDFPAEVLKQYDIEAQHPDAFVRDVIDLNAGQVARVIHEQAAELKNPPHTPAELLERLHRQGLPLSVARLRELLGV
jgi:hypothetical protein